MRFFDKIFNDGGRHIHPFSIGLGKFLRSEERTLVPQGLARIVSGVNRQLHVQIGCKLIIRNRKDELTRQAERNKLRITNYKLNPKGIEGVNACRKKKRSS